MIVRHATLADIMTFFPQPTPACVLESDGEILAIGGVLERKGRIWAFVDVKEALGPRAGLIVMRALLRHLRTIAEPVYIACDEGFETAPRLLKALGFRPTEEMHFNERVWVR